MIAFFNFSDTPRTPAAMAGTIVGQNLRFWRGAISMMGAVPAAQVELAQSVWGLGTSAAVAAPDAVVVQKPTTKPATKPAARRKTVARSKAKPISRKAATKQATPQTAPARTAASKAAPAKVTSASKPFASQRKIQGEPAGATPNTDATRPSAAEAKPTRPTPVRKRHRAPSKPAEMPAAASSLQAEQSSKRQAVSPSAAATKVAGDIKAAPKAAPAPTTQATAETGKPVPQVKKTTPPKS